MGERFFCESFSETKSGKRATYFEPVPSHESSLKRFFCEHEAPKMRCRYDESLFSRNLIFGRPVGFSSRKSSQKECFAPFFAGRSVFRAGKVHRKSASHHFRAPGGGGERWGHPARKFTVRVLRTTERNASHHYSWATCGGRWLAAVDGAPSTTWGGRWSAIDWRCEALFVDFFETWFGRSRERGKASNKL